LYPGLIFDPEHISIRAAIDGGAPLVDAVAAHYNAPKSLVRALRGVTPAHWQLELDHAYTDENTA
jgi:hypothetical protein